MKSILYPDLPPLDSLMVFEVAARHESFSKAADELCLTASAVAHHIKKIEAALGIALFVRHARGVSLSPQSREYVAYVQKCLSELNRQSGQIRDFTLRPLKVSTQHAIAQLWLQPKLGEYQDQHPDWELEITAQSRIDYLPEDTDIAISFFEERPAGESWQLLWEEVLLPVCHPEYREQKPVLYRDIHWWQDWAHWQQQALQRLEDSQRLSISRIRSTSLYVLALQSVLDKCGVMVARKSLLLNYLERGALIAWPEVGIPEMKYGAYYLYQSPASMNNPFANEFRAWLYQKINDQKSS